MAKFFYKARNKSNELVDDYVKADNISSAAHKLEHKGLIILELNEVEDLDNFSNIKNIKRITPNTILSLQEKKSFFSSLYSLYKSGTPLFESFKSMMTSSNNPNVRGVCYVIIKKIEKGCTLKESMQSVAKTVGYAYTMLIAAGESAGTLIDVLHDIIENINREEEVRNKIVASLIYPGLLFSLVIWIGLFNELGLSKVMANLYTMPVCQKTTTFIGAAVGATLILASMVGTGFFAFKKRLFFSKISNSPLIYHLFRNNYMANFFNILSLSYSSGVPPAEAIELASSGFNNEEAAKKLKKVETMVQNGCEVTTALNISGMFSDFAISQISTGEKSGELGQKAQVVADYYSKNMNMATSVFSNSIGLISLIVVLLIGAFLIAKITNNMYSGYFNF